VKVERADHDEFIDLNASHDGYKAAFGLVHERRWQLAAAGDEFHGQDLFIPDGEDAPPRDVAIRFHLHPTVKATAMNGGRIRLVLPNDEIWLFEASDAALRIEESVFFPTTDRPRRTEQIVLAFNTGEVSRIRWRFAKVSAALELAEKT
jgi:uncharacterized heparinase superfamily protein